jgi:hypothetical protein
MYRAFGLLQPATDFTMEEAEKRLRTRFPGYSVSRSGEQISISKDSWEFELRLNSDASVLAESSELAEKIAGAGDGSDIASCPQRVEVWSDTPDPMMEHFNDFLVMVEVLKSFRSVIAIDPNEPALM